MIHKFVSHIIDLKKIKKLLNSISHYLLHIKKKKIDHSVAKVNSYRAKV